MLAQVSVCEINIRETAITETISKRMRARIRATPFSFLRFIEPQLGSRIRFLCPASLVGVERGLMLARRWDGGNRHIVLRCYLYRTTIYCSTNCQQKRREVENPGF